MKNPNPPPSGHSLLRAATLSLLRRSQRRPLWSLVPEFAKESGPRSAPMIDVMQFGYFKVLGKGTLPEGRPVVVKAKLVSKTAEKKIKAAGGAAVLTT